MSVQPSDLYARLKHLRVQCTAVQSGITDVVNMLNEMGLSQRPDSVCPTCTLSVRDELVLAEHIYTSHDGPLPDHWVALDFRVVDPVRPAT